MIQDLRGSVKKKDGPTKNRQSFQVETKDLYGTTHSFTYSF